MGNYHLHTALVLSWSTKSRLSSTLYTCWQLALLSSHTPRQNLLTHSIAHYFLANRHCATPIQLSRHLRISRERLRVLLPTGAWRPLAVPPSSLTRHLDPACHHCHPEINIINRCLAAALR